MTSTRGYILLIQVNLLVSVCTCWKEYGRFPQHSLLSKMLVELKAVTVRIQIDGSDYIAKISISITRNFGRRRAVLA